MNGPSTDRRTVDETRPLGVTILCLIAGAFPVVSILLVPLVFAEIPRFAMGALLFSIAQLVLVYGLWSMRSWAWVWGLIVLACNAVLSPITNDTLLATMVSLLLMGYLWNVRPYYRSTSDPS